MEEPSNDHSGNVSIAGSCVDTAMMRDLERSRCPGVAPSSQIYSACVIALVMCGPAFLRCDAPGVLGLYSHLCYLLEAMGDVPSPPDSGRDRSHGQTLPY